MNRVQGLVILIQKSIESQHFSPQTALEKLWRQKIAIQVELDNQKRQASSRDQQESENTKIPM